MLTPSFWEQTPLEKATAHIALLGRVYAALLLESKQPKPSKNRSSKVRREAVLTEEEKARGRLLEEEAGRRAEAEEYFKLRKLQQARVSRLTKTKALEELKTLVASVNRREVPIPAELACIDLILEKYGDDSETMRLFPPSPEKVTKAILGAIDIDKIVKESVAEAKRKLAEDARKKQKCFVASVVFEDAEHPDVVLLRKWRDVRLGRTRPGRILIHAYSFWGPIAAKAIGNRTLAKGIVRRLLTLFVSRIRNKASKRHW